MEQTEPEVLTDMAQLTPLWLTQRLRARGILPEGEVTEVRVAQSRQTNVSQVHHVTVCYTAGAPEAAPSRLFVKIPGADFAWGSREIEFYTRLAPAMRGAALPILLCYDAAYDPATGRSHLLLEDLSTTHFSTEGPLPPTRAHSEQMVDAYAALHAAWWEHPRLGRDIGERLTGERIEGFLEMARGKLAGFRAFMGERLPAAQGAVLERVVSAWPERRRRRLLQGRGITIVHRDPHPLNVLYPRDVQRDTVRLIDWQSWRVDTGTDDLAYWMACHWPPQDRARLEEDLLRRYHARLVEGGVTDYTGEDCRYDYRASVVRCLFFLVGAWSPAQWERGWWWDRVQRGLEAYRALQCGDLFEAQR